MSEGLEVMRTEARARGRCMTSWLAFLKVHIVSVRQLNIFLFIYSNTVRGKDLVDTLETSQ